MKKINFLDLKSQQKKLKLTLNKKLKNVLKNTNYIMGPEVSELEKRLENYTKAKHCITCASGTDALILSLLSLKVGRGDQVICPSFTFPATAEAILITGATPIFVDVSKTTYNLCYKELENILEKNKSKKNRIKAIISVDLFGLPANYSRLNKIATEYKVSIIADAAQSFGGSLKNIKVGAINDITYIFFPANH